MIKCGIRRRFNPLNRTTLDSAEWLLAILSDTPNVSMSCCTATRMVATRLRRQREHNFHHPGKYLRHLPIQRGQLVGPGEQWVHQPDSDLTLYRMGLCQSIASFRSVKPNFHYRTRDACSLLSSSKLNRDNLI